MKNPIGIFDSGVGGLTVYKAVRRQYPHEDIVYFGDTARVPYGPKSAETIIHYSIQNARFLLQNHAKMIIVACNTASSLALAALQQMLRVPVIGMIEPGSSAAVKASRNGKIGVIGTYGTVSSHAYQNEIHKLLPAAQVLEKPCPLFVSLVEEGWEDHPVTHQIAEEYLEEFIKDNYDTLVLGCTHYPILKNTISKITGGNMELIDSAEVIAACLHEVLPQIETSGRGEDQFFVSDNEENFRKIASHIVGREIENLHRVKLAESWFK